MSDVEMETEVKAVEAAAGPSSKPAKVWVCGVGGGGGWRKPSILLRLRPTGVAAVQPAVMSCSAVVMLLTDA